MANLSNPTIEINDDTIKYKNNSLTFKIGKGEKKIRSQSAGGNSIDIVETVDGETKIAIVKFIMLTTAENLSLYESWQDAGKGGNTIRLSEKESDLTLSFRKMSLISDEEITTGAEGEFAIEFQGPPIS
jgi:hypothetical protein